MCNCHEISLQCKLMAQLTEQEGHTTCVNCGHPVKFHIHPLWFEAFIIEEEEE